MVEPGILELVFFLVPIAVTAFVVYWVIRLGVRHGTLDAYRIDRADRDRSEP